VPRLAETAKTVSLSLRMTMTGAANILITGLPGSGKTTLIRRLADELRECSPTGFLSEEIREQGMRKGFRLATFDGARTGVIAHVDIKGTSRVGRYGVDLEGFERFLADLHAQGALRGLVIIDEIGKMECLSATFRRMVRSLLDAPAPFIATIALKAGGFIEEIKHRPDVLLSEIDERNGEALLLDIIKRVRSLAATG
jgi:nucleoside-triphosphatase